MSRFTVAGAETGRFLPKLSGYVWGIEAVVFSSDGKTVAGGDSSTIIFWDWKNSRKPRGKRSKGENQK